MFIMKPSVQKWNKKITHQENSRYVIKVTNLKNLYSLSKSFAVLNPANNPIPAMMKMIEG